MSDKLYTSVKRIVETSASLTTIQTESKKVSGLIEKDHDTLMMFVDVIDGFKEDKSLIMDIIKCLVLVVETIQGKKQGELKKSEAYAMFQRILNLSDLSQRDKKLYTGIFSGAVELIFWGKDVFKIPSGFKFFCCK